MIRDILNRAARASSAQSVSTQGGSAGTSAGTAPGPSSTTPAAASSAQPVSTQGGSAGTSAGTAPGPSSTTPAAASTPSSLNNLLNQGTIPPTIYRFSLIPCHDTVGQDAAVEKVCEFLKDVNVGIVGIYGMGGVGKTALMKTVHNKFLAGCDLDFVLYFVVSKEWNYERIRRAIMIAIRGPIEPDGVDIVKLYNCLLRKKFVLLLDDVWEHIDLIELGVPIPTNTDTCKIIFTTRSEEICQKMRPDRNFKIDCLGPTDSWALFEKNVGEKALKSHPRVADQVMKECCGLPLALIIVGRAMSCKYTPKEWEHALVILQNNPHQMPDVEKKVFSCLEFSYLSLGENTVQKCFLYCALFPEDFSIPKKVLVDYWIGEGFMGKCENLEQLRNRGYHIIGVLLGACLFENSKDENGFEAVKMHDIIRDMALWIVSDHGSKQNVFFVHPGQKLTSSEISGRWNAAERIYVRSMEELPESPSCPALTTLIFQANPGLGLQVSIEKNLEDDGAGITEKEMQINHKGPLLFDRQYPDRNFFIPRAMERRFDDLMSRFFQFMPVLRLLDLDSPWFTVLPRSVATLFMLRYLRCKRLKLFPHELGRISSLEIIDMSSYRQCIPTSLDETIGQLVALTMLNLGGTNLESLPLEIGMLGKLEILDLSRNDISVLPSTIGDLRELRQLVLHNTWLHSLPEEVVYLSKLEVLYLCHTRISVLPSMVGRLSKLRLLDLSSTSIKTLPEEIFYLLNLEVLNVSRTNIGIIPPSISKLIELRELNLEDTLICKLPEEVMSLTRLEVLKLNYSTPILPTWINQLHQLRELHLSNAQVALQLGKLSKLKIFLSGRLLTTDDI